jgi:precorrin-3B methylase
VVALYNPISRHRPWQLGRAIEILRGHRAPATPIVLARNVGRDAESITITTFEDFDDGLVDMRTVVIIGSTTTREFRDGNGREWVYTPRTYPAESR